MHDKSYLLSLLDYNIWARDLYYAQVVGLPDGELTRQRPSIMNSFLVLLNHFLVVEKVWMAHMKGRPHGFDKLQTVLHEDVASLQAAQHDMDREIRGYIEGLSDEELEEEVSYELIGGNTGRLPRYMILTPYDHARRLSPRVHCRHDGAGAGAPGAPGHSGLGTGGARAIGIENSGGDVMARKSSKGPRIDMHTHVALPEVLEMARKVKVRGSGPGKQNWIPAGSSREHDRQAKAVGEEARRAQGAARRHGRHAASTSR